MTDDLGPKTRDLGLEDWERRSVLDEPRLSEVVEMYRSMGLEVRLEQFDPSDCDGCSTCLDGAPEKYKIVYTRGSPKGEDGLFD